PDQQFEPLRSADPEPATEAQRDELTLTAGEDITEMGQWIKDLAAESGTFADRLAERQSLTGTFKEPHYRRPGHALPAWPAPDKDAILQPPKPEIRPSAQVLERAIARDADREAAD